MRRWILVFLSLLIATWTMAAQEWNTRTLTVRTVPVAGPFSFPWCVAWLPDGTPLVTERDGRLNVVRDGRSFAVAGMPPVSVGGQGGLFDVLVLPPADGRQELLLSYVHEQAGGRSLRVSRATLTGNSS